ncbi:hypothetical protein KY366_05425 [Candidatus Woesearchaeota archaeon]|nr:hypothetical protein [Candidatus Woesearchaeota archaeon]
MEKIYNALKKYEKQAVFVIGTGLILTLSAASRLICLYNNEKEKALAALDNSLMAQIMSEMPKNSLTEKTLDRDVIIYTFKDPGIDAPQSGPVSQIPTQAGYEATLLDIEPFGGRPSVGDSLDGRFYPLGPYSQFGYYVEKEGRFPEVKPKYLGDEINGSKVKATQQEIDKFNRRSEGFLTRLRETRRDKKKEKI